MIQVIRTIFAFGPLIFAFSFLTPLVAQTLVALELSPPLGLTPLQTGLIAAAVLGGLAQWRGRWI